MRLMVENTDGLKRFYLILVWRYLNASVHVNKSFANFPALHLARGIFLENFRSKKLASF